MVTEKKFKISYRRPREQGDGWARREVLCETITEAENYADELRVEIGNKDVKVWLWLDSAKIWCRITDATDDEIAIIARTFSMPWQPDGSGWTVPGTRYEISQNGPAAWDLRYNATLLHTNVSLFGCMAAADRHRGISDAYVDSKIQKVIG